MISSFSHALSLNRSQLWDPEANFKLLGTLTGHTETINKCAFSPSGSVIVSPSDDKTLRVWRATTSGAVFANITPRIRLSTSKSESELFQMKQDVQILQSEKKDLIARIEKLEALVLSAVDDLQKKVANLQKQLDQKK